jgi:general secretion pathway protein D
MLNIFNWRGFGGFLTVPNATYNFGKTLSKAEVLANPKIRVKNREKSKFNVATREPITTTSTTGTIVSTNVQYVDVGIKVNAEPTIMINNEINLKLSLEVSSKLGEKTAADGTTLITIGTRNLETVLSLKDGETSIIGGLISGNKSKSTRKPFLLGDLPLIGPLVSGYDNKKDKTELVLALTPRIIRLPAVPEQELASFWSGREDEPSVASPYSSFKQPEFAPEQSGGPQNGELNPSVAPIGQPPQAGPSGQPTFPPVAEPVARLRLTAPATVPVGGIFAVDVGVSDLRDLTNAPFTLVYDPNLVEPAGIAEGLFLQGGGSPTEFRTSVAQQTGEVGIVLRRLGSGPGVSGSGNLLSARFKARKQGFAPFSAKNIVFASSAGTAIPVTPFNIAVEVK